MANKKHLPSPLEEPPSASSSSEEENSSEDASSEEEAEEVQAKTPPPSSSNPKPPSSSGSDSASGSEYDSESLTNTNAAKPLASKPMKVQTTLLPANSDSKQRSNPKPPSPLASKPLKKKDLGKKVQTTPLPAKQPSKKKDLGKKVQTTPLPANSDSKQLKKDVGKKVQTTSLPANSDSKQSSEKKDVEKSLSFTEMLRFRDEMGLSSLNMGTMKRGMELIGESDNAMLEERWKKVRIAEMEVFITKAKLVRDQTRSVLEAYKNSN